MKVRPLFILIVLAFAVSPLRSQLAEEDVRLFELPVKELDQLSARHLQGTISFVINGEDYSCFVEGETVGQRILACSALLGDLQRASTLQIKSCRHGKSRKVTVLVLFYGNRVIPKPLRIEVVHPKTSPDGQKVTPSGKRPAPAKTAG